MAAATKRVLVTGGTGLVGRAIEHVLKTDKHADEEWFFPSSKEGDLRCVKLALLIRTLVGESLLAAETRRGSRRFEPVDVPAMF